MSLLSTVRIMTSNKNPLDWDYSSSRAAAGKRQAEDWTILACLHVSLAVGPRSVPHTSSMISSMRSTLSFYPRHEGEFKLWPVPSLRHKTSFFTSPCQHHRCSVFLWSVLSYYHLSTCSSFSCCIRYTPLFVCLFSSFIFIKV